MSMVICSLQNCSKTGKKEYSLDKKKNCMYGIILYSVFVQKQMIPFSYFL